MFAIVLYIWIMTERCPIRSAEKFGESFLADSDIPQACINCINKAIDNKKTDRVVTDTKDRANESLREYYGEGFNPDDADGWEATIMEHPSLSAHRKAHIEIGYDINTHSYIPETTHTTTSVAFVCPND